MSRILQPGCAVRVGKMNIPLRSRRLCPQGVKAVVLKPLFKI